MGKLTDGCTCVNADDCCDACTARVNAEEEEYRLTLMNPTHEKALNQILASTYAQRSEGNDRLFVLDLHGSKVIIHATLLPDNKNGEFQYRIISITIT